MRKIEHADPGCMIFSLWITTGLSLIAEETKPTRESDNRLEEILQRGN
ncbi:MAG: hypothetical protein ACLSA6_00565 [Holdemania massiliensis]